MYRGHDPKTGRAGALFAVRVALSELPYSIGGCYARPSCGVEALDAHN
jgi:hypothetical protein